MSDITVIQPLPETSATGAAPAPKPGLAERLAGIDRVLLATLAVLAVLALADGTQVKASVLFTVNALVSIAPFFLLSVLAAAGAKATGLDRQIARAFQSRPLTAVTLAALFGALSPFCSCGVVPVIAGLLGAGVPLAPVMAFWIASPLMDPQMFLLMLAVYGVPFTLFKAGAAVVMGLAAGYGTHLLVARGAFADPLKGAVTSCCGARKRALATAPVAWAFWREGERRQLFAGEARATSWFLFKWLALAFVIESLMVAYIPADQIGRFLGSGHWWAVPASVLAGIPAYLNGFAAIPTVKALMDLGMAPGAGMAFMLAGGVTSIPAAMAVWALVKRDTFLWYIALGLVGSLVAGLAAEALLG